MFWKIFISENCISNEFFDKIYLKRSKNFAADCKYHFHAFSSYRALWFHFLTGYRAPENPKWSWQAEVVWLESGALKWCQDMCVSCWCHFFYHCQIEVSRSFHYVLWWPGVESDVWDMLFMATSNFIHKWDGGKFPPAFQYGKLHSCLTFSLPVENTAWMIILEALY